MPKHFTKNFTLLKWLQDNHPDIILQYRAAAKDRKNEMAAIWFRKNYIKIKKPLK